jgi:hypothetical protein
MAQMVFNFLLLFYVMRSKQQHFYILMTTGLGSSATTGIVMAICMGAAFKGELYSYYGFLCGSCEPLSPLKGAFGNVLTSRLMTREG